MGHAQIALNDASRQSWNNAFTTGRVISGIPIAAFYTSIMLLSCGSLLTPTEVAEASKTLSKGPGTLLAIPFYLLSLPFRYAANRIGRTPIYTDNYANTKLHQTINKLDQFDEQQVTKFLNTVVNRYENEHLNSSKESKKVITNLKKISILGEKITTVKEYMKEESSGVFKNDGKRLFTIIDEEIGKTETKNNNGTQNFLQKIYKFVSGCFQSVLGASSRASENRHSLMAPNKQSQTNNNTIPLLPGNG